MLIIFNAEIGQSLATTHHFLKDHKTLRLLHSNAVLIKTQMHFYAFFPSDPSTVDILSDGGIKRPSTQEAATDGSDEARDTR